MGEMVMQVLVGSVSLMGIFIIIEKENVQKCEKYTYNCRNKPSGDLDLCSAV